MTMKMTITLNGKSFSSLGASSLKDITAVGRLHASTETMTALALYDRRRFKMFFHRAKLYHSPLASQVFSCLRDENFCPTSTYRKFSALWPALLEIFRRKEPG